MLDKRTIDKKRLGKFAVITVILLLGLKFAQSTEMKMSLDAWEDVHQWRSEGECAECHSGHDYVKQAVDLSARLPIPAARTHSERFRRFTHGKDERFAAYRCRTCHESDSCQSCHATLPESHSSDFVAPRGDSAGSLRHALLAKTNPSSCLTCHKSFVEGCTTCHGVDEVIPWQRDAAVPLVRWTNLLNQG
jgi:hypothetical protein